MRTLLFVALLLAWPTAAHAWTSVPRPPDASGYNRAGADGGRWAVAQYGDAKIAVFDDRAPGWKVLPIAAGCRFDGAVGAGRAVLLCPGPTFTRVLTLIDLRTGAQTAVGSTPAYYDSVEALRVGTHWIEARVSGYHYSLVRYYRIRDAAERAVDGPRRIADLDRAEVDQPLCAPLRRPAIKRDIDNTAPYEIMERDAGTHVFAWRPGAYSGPDGYFTWRCGKQRPRRLLRCPCGVVQTGGGAIMEVSGEDRVRFVRLKDRRVRSFAVDPLFTILHTRRYLLAAGVSELRARRLPR